MRRLQVKRRSISRENCRKMLRDQRTLFSSPDMHVPTTSSVYFTYTHVHTHTHTYTLTPPLHPPTHVHTHTHIHTHTHTHTTPTPLHRDLPPSQGGRYGGFGNTVEPAKNEESEFFSGAWSSISSVSPPNHEKLAPQL